MDISKRFDCRGMRKSLRNRCVTVGAIERKYQASVGLQCNTVGMKKSV